jgi:Rieske Fe-S protein
MNRFGVAAAIAVLIIGAAAVALLTSPEPNEPGELSVGTIDEIESEGVVYVPDPGLYVVATENGLLALSDDPRHLDGERVLYCSRDQTFSSPAHGEKFDRQGRYLAGPASGDLGRYPVETRRNQVIVDISSGPHLPERSTVRLQREEPSQCGGPEDPPGFYADSSA